MSRIARRSSNPLHLKGMLKLASTVGEKNNEEATKRLFIDRAVDRSRDYLDHRDNCHPELATFEDGSERSI
jgi:hypothetical protein